jgi:hypothetical protein
MKLVLEKPWEWNEQALMYFDRQRPEMFRFPFWWYHIEGREVRLIKQISKNCGICFAENRWVEREATFAEQLQEKLATYEIDAETASELERRSWMTLGEVESLEAAPKQVTIVHPNGGGCIYNFHPVHGRMLNCTWINQDGEIIYKAMYVYNEKHFAAQYGNTTGMRMHKVWDKEEKKYLWKNA